MLISLNRRSLLTFYFTIIRPCFTLTYSNMSGITEADKYSIVYVTVPRMEEGRNLGRMVVENKLAACVNIIPQITSIYEWKGKMTEDSELLMMIKTRTSEVDRLAEFMRTHHPYEVCEVIAVPIQNGNLPYLNWIGQQVTQNKKA